MDFVVARTFNSLYIALDIAWLLIYAGILLYFKKQTAITVGLIMGVAYSLVDYGIFYKHLHTRQIEGTDPFWFLLWLMAIGIGVQFAWEAALLIDGIRPPMCQPIVINSLIETNLGLPYIYYIHRYFTAR